MVASIAHRGPDEESVWVSETDPVFLGHRRLSILDLVGGKQPMPTSDGKLIVTFNGEIYNHAALRRELEAAGHIFVTDHSDTEVLLHGYRAWGEDLPIRLNGMFAFAIWDRERKRLFCARDRFGEKPFFFTQQGGTLAFGSTLDALRSHSGLAFSLSSHSFQKYLAYNYLPSPRTIYHEARQLPAGHTLVFDLDAHAARLQRYWDFNLEPFDSIPADPEEEGGGRLRELLERSIRARLEADVPVGIFLSGGIDSSAVAALACRAGAQVKTFTIGFTEKSFNESEHAQFIANFLHTDHHQEILSVAQLPGLLGEITARLDQPLGDASLLPTSLLSQFARRHVKVALGGDGGDELFAGYDPFLALRKAQVYQTFTPKPVHLAIRLLVSRLPVSHRNMSLGFKLKRTLQGLNYPSRFWLPVWMAGFDPAQADDLLADPLPLDELYSEAIELWDRHPSQNLVERTLTYFTKLYLQDDILVKADRASMAHGLEVRSPFLDYDLVDFVRRIPFHYKLRGGQTKYLLKAALTSLLPQETLYRSKKGFGVPVGEWLRNGKIPFDSEELPVPVHPDFVRNALSEHRNGQSDHRMLLWNLSVFRYWQNARGTLAWKE